MVVYSRRLFVACVVVFIAGLIFKVSYFQDNTEAYLFPAVVAAAMLVFSLISLFRESFDLCVDDFQPFPFERQWPVIVMMAAGVLSLETLGMYVTTFLILVLVSYWYSPQEQGGKRARQSLVMAAGFTLAMYVLFTVLLKVQVPRGVLI